MSTEIRSREENGAMIFEKDKLDDLEIKFFNPEYFSKIGFPDAEIKIVNKTTGEELPSSNDSDVSVYNPIGSDAALEQSTVDENVTDEANDQPVVPTPEESQPATENTEQSMTDSSTEVNVGSMEREEGPVNEIKGGDYSNVQSLTAPFRYFVYFVQSKFSKRNDASATSVTESTSDSDNKNGSILNTFYDKVANAFSKNDSSSQNVTTNPIVDLEAKGDEPVVSKGEPVNNDVQNTDSNSNDANMSLEWVVKIPIATDDESDQISEYKREELKLNQILREHKMEKINNIIVKGQVFNIGDRYIKIAQTVEEGQPQLEVNPTKLPGTKMSKYSKNSKKSKN